MKIIMQVKIVEIRLYHNFNTFAIICILVQNKKGFPGGSAIKNLPANAGDVGSIPGLGRSSGEGNGHPLQYSCLGNSMDRGAWWTTVHGVANEPDNFTSKQCDTILPYPDPIPVY